VQTTPLPGTMKVLAAGLSTLAAATQKLLLRKPLSWTTSAAALLIASEGINPGVNRRQGAIFVYLFTPL
jgi:hypothetical protein